MPWKDVFKQRKAESIGTGVGVLGGAAVGAKIGAGIGLASGGWGMAATVPLGAIGGVLVGLIGNKIGTEMDHKKRK